jgi:PAS domain S-box-containing protein
MFKAAIGQAEGIDTQTVVARVIRQCRSQLGGRLPQAGIVLAAAEFDHAPMLAAINLSFPGIELIGCTTAGDFSSSYGYSDDSIILMAFASDDTRMAAGLGRGLTDDCHRAVETAIAQARGKLGEAPQVCIALPDGFSPSFNQILARFNEVLPCPLLGGCAARQDDLKKRPLQFHQNQILTDAVPILLFGGPLEVAFAVANSWKPIGKKAVITETQGRMVRRIGQMTAVDFYRHYLGEHGFPTIEFPLAVYDDDPRHFYLRGPLEYNLEDGSITLTESIPQGATVQLTEAERETLLADTAHTTMTLRESSRTFQPAFAMAFSCYLRKETLGTRTPEELALLKRNLPEGLPIAGFYGFGEIGPLVRGRPSFYHNATLVTLLVGQTADLAMEIRPPHQPLAEAERLRPEAAPAPEKVDTIARLRRENQFLQRQLERSERYRRRLEHTKDLNAVLHHKIIAEIEAARQEIAQHEAELHKSEEKHRRIVETAGEGFILMDENLVVKDVNQTYCRLLGYQRAEIVGRRGDELLNEGSGPFLLASKEALLAEDYREFEGVATAKNGTRIPVLVHASTLRDGDGRFMGNMAFITDMTEHKQALSLASEVQKSLQPQVTPQIDGFDIAGRNVSCEEIGGDYFDFLWRSDAPDRPFSIVVGDIAGHGVAAALLMTSARAFLRMRASQPGTMADIITAMNRHLTEDARQTGRFMSLFYLTIDPKAREVEWVRAGHEPAILYDPAQDRFETLMGEGMSLGVDKKAAFEINRKHRIPAGSIIAIGTDGIWESFNQSGEMFGRDRFQKIIRRHATLTAKDIVEAVFQELHRFSLGVKPSDDITLVVVKCAD